MPFYPPKITSRSRAPKYAGILSDANAVGTAASFECGSFVKISLEIGDDAKVIRTAKFQTNGCSYMVAAAEIVAERLNGSELAGLHGLAADEYASLLADHLEVFPPARKQCAELVFNAVKDALADHRSRLLEEFRGEKALICTCFGVTEESIEAYIDSNPPVTVAEVTASCRAGGGCGSCRMLIQELIDARSFEIDN